MGMDPPTDFSLTSPQAGQSVSSSVTSNEPVVLTRNMPMYGIFVRIFILEEQSLQGNCSSKMFDMLKVIALCTTLSTPEVASGRGMQRDFSGLSSDASLSQTGELLG